VERKRLDARKGLSSTTFLSLVREVAADAARQSDPDTCLRRLRSGLIHLGFRRAGIWITEPVHPTTLRGTWGTGWDGAEVDEHTLCLPIGRFAFSERIVAGERVCVGHVPIPPDQMRPAHLGAVPHDGPPNYASVALRADGQLLGLISVDMLPGDEEIDFERVAALELVADQVAVAIARGHLVAELRAANEALVAEVQQHRELEAELTALYEATKQITSSLDLPATLGSILTAILRLSESTGAGIALLDATGTTLRYEAVRTSAGMQDETWSLPVGHGLSGIVVQTGCPINVPDLAHEPRWVWTAHVAPEMRSALVLPLHRHDRVIGVLTAWSAQRAHYSAAREQLLVRLAEPAALAIEHARQIAELAQVAAALQASQQALRESAASFRLLFQANPHPMWVYDVQTLQFLEVNDAAIAHYGYTRDEFLRMTITEIRPAEEVAPLLTTVEQSRQGYRHTGYWRHRPKDGRLIDVEITSHPLEFAGRRAVIVVAFDITERKLLEEQLRQSQKLEAIGQLAGGVAHDFNNLLTVITGYGELVDSRLPANSPEREAVQQILRASESAAALTRQLLAFSRRQIIAPKEIDLNEVVEQLGKMLRRVIGEDIALTMTLAPNLGRVRADPGQIEQILLNLATNARDAMPLGGTLTLETANGELDEASARHRAGAQPGPHVLLAVSDTGMGMDAATQARIFEPFFTTKEVGKGTGLGLAAVYGIVKQSEGAIDVDSEPGHGTTFKIYLPRLATVSPRLPPQRPPVELPTGTETILVIEDDPSVRLLARAVLEGRGYTVLDAAGGEQARTVAADHTGRIDLLLTDVVMPRESGWQVAERLQVRYPDAKIVYMSGYTDDMVVRHGVVETSVHFLQKPFTPLALAQKVRQVLDATGR
jgi:two-component system cell cycle sensor histidine kinase/response regulator CckA